MDKLSEQIKQILAENGLTGDEREFSATYSLDPFAGTITIFIKPSPEVE